MRSIVGNHLDGTIFECLSIILRLSKSLPVSLGTPGSIHAYEKTHLGSDEILRDGMDVDEDFHILKRAQIRGWNASSERKLQRRGDSSWSPTKYIISHLKNIYFKCHGLLQILPWWFYSLFDMFQAFAERPVPLVGSNLWAKESEENS